MAKPISNEKRELIIKHIQTGQKRTDICKWLSISMRTLERIYSKFKTTGNYNPNPQNGGRKPMVTIEEMEKVFAKIEEQPDITLLELIEEFNLPISASALCRRLKKRGYTFKKRLYILVDKKEMM